MRVARLILDGPRPGDWNMAADEALLHEAASGVTTLRFYQWSEPTLSLGYFQAHRDRQQHAASRNCPCVRRSSGGGAILHDRELTYSFATPVQTRWGSSASAVYDIFHETLMATLREWGVTAHLCSPPLPTAGPPLPEAFLCFQRRSAGDVLAGTGKICGSAQRRQRGALLQHGSVILQTSPFAPEIAGIAELCGVAIPAGLLADAWSGSLSSPLGVRWEKAARSAREDLAVEELKSRRFSSGQWLDRR